MTDNGVMVVNMSASFLRNDGGQWACSDTNLYERGGSFPGTLTGTTSTCVGQGGYDGLWAVLVWPDDAPDYPFDGLVFPGGLPPVPEPPAFE